jgi:WD40 repeat protein
MATNQNKTDGVNSIAFSNGYSNILATGHQDSTTKLWEVESYGGPLINLKLLANVNKNRNPVISVALHFIDINTSFLATCDLDSTTIWRILKPHQTANKKWKVEEIQTLENIGVTSIVFHPTANPPILAISSSDDTVKLLQFNASFNLITLLDTIRIGGNGVNSIAFNNNGTLLATGNRNNTVKLFNISISEEINYGIINILNKNTGPIFSVAFDYTGQFLAAGSQDMTTNIWRIYHGQNSSWTILHIAKLTGHTDMVTSVAFLPKEYLHRVDNLVIATGSLDTTTKLWVVKNMSVEHEINWVAACVETIKSDNIVKSIAFKSIGDVNVGIAYFAIGLNISRPNYDTLKKKFTMPKKSNSNVTTFIFSNHPLYQQSGGGLQNESRFFKLVSVNGKEVDGGRYELPSKTKSGKEQTRGPKDKASIAFSEICKKNNKKGECSYKFAIQETTRGSNKKVYHYEGKRVKLTKPIVLELNDKKVVIKYKNIIAPIH